MTDEPKTAREDVEDVAKIVEALRPFSVHAEWIMANINDYFDEMVCAGVPESPIIFGDFMRALAVLPLAEALAGKIEGVEKERDDALETVDSVQWDCRNALIRAEAAASKLAASEAKIEDLKTSVIAFGAPWIVEYAKDRGLDGLHPDHFDILEKCGARMDEFKRAVIAAAATPEEPSDHEAEGAMLYRGHHEARTNAALTGAPPTSEDSPGRL